MYRAKKPNAGSTWDDNLYSVRGLEESLHVKKEEKSRMDKRKELIEAILAEQERLKNTDAGREELSSAAKAIKKGEDELATELLRGISCSHSKGDKQRAIGIALKDERASGYNRGSARKLLTKVTGKISTWMYTSSKSLGVSESEDVKS